MRVMTSKVGKQQITNYCNLLAQMFLISQDWDDNTTINTVVINTLDKWAMFNKKVSVLITLSLYTFSLSLTLFSLLKHYWIFT